MPTVVPVTSYDTAKALLAYFTNSGNLAAINNDTDLVYGGYLVDATATPQATVDCSGDSSPYLYLKLGDRDLIGDGLTVCFIPINDEEVSSYSGYGVDVTCRVDILCYYRGQTDPEKWNRGLMGLSRSITRELNKPANVNALYMANIERYAHEARIFHREYVYAEKVLMAERIPAVSLWWRGIVTYNTE